MGSTGSPSSDELAGRLLGPNTYELLGVDSDTPISIVNAWHRGGDETYCTDFLVGEGSDAAHLIAKACVKLFPKETMNEWLRKRSLLENNGANLPDLVTVDKAVIVEEFIPYEFGGEYRLASKEKRDMLKKRFLETFSILCNSGFSPLSLHDLRSRGEDCVVIDLGYDLGPISHQTKPEEEISVLAEKAFSKVSKK